MQSDLSTSLTQAAAHSQQRPVVCAESDHLSLLLRPCGRAGSVQWRCMRTAIRCQWGSSPSRRPSHLTASLAQVCLHLLHCVLLPKAGNHVKGRLHRAQEEWSSCPWQTPEISAGGCIVLAAGHVALPCLHDGHSRLLQWTRHSLTLVQPWYACTPITRQYTIQNVLVAHASADRPTVLLSAHHPAASWFPRNWVPFAHSLLPVHAC